MASFITSGYLIMEEYFFFIMGYKFANVVFFWKCLFGKYFFFNVRLLS